jgi:hypothetical protein
MDVMVDIETLSIDYNAVILSLGAVKFDPYKLETISIPRLEDGFQPGGGNFTITRRMRTYKYFYQNISIKSCLDVGLEVDASTVLFWLDQPEEARKALLSDTLSLRDTLRDFYDWTRLHDRDSHFVESDPKYYWSHGASFDLPILSHAYKSVNGKEPWGFREMQDTRTLFRLCSDKRYKVEMPDEGLKHHALFDAWRQAVAVQRCFNFLNLGE